MVLIKKTARAQRGFSIPKTSLGTPRAAEQNKFCKSSAYIVLKHRVKKKKLLTVQGIIMSYRIFKCYLNNNEEKEKNNV